ncbi:MAG: ABC transporter substrate-binding protein [Rhizobiales bacterium]|nr:ABC transporter substrate-binding protein [Hyphomicrobiales bacterium]
MTLVATAALAAIASAHAETRFLDHRNKEIVFEKPPEKIVSMFASGPIVYYAVEGKADHIAGVYEKGLKMYQTSIYGELIPEFLKLKSNVGGEGFVPNVEAILEINPDAVLQWTFDPKIIEPLERVGLKVVGWDCCTNQHRRDYLTLSGYMSNRNDRAQLILQKQDASNKALRDTFAKVAPADYKTILPVDRIGDSIRVIANSSQDYSLSAARDVAADGTDEWWRTIDAEQLLVWNPEIIVIPAYATDLKPADFYSNPTFANLAAVKNKRVYKFPQFNRSPDAAEIYLSDDWLARIANPDYFKNPKEFGETVKAGYKLIYQKDLTDEQLRAIMEFEQNKDSAGYSDIFG